MMKGYRTILVGIEEKVATVWLNRPDRRNAFSFEMSAELQAALTELDADDGVRAIVVTGMGSFFSAGADLEATGSTFSEIPDAGDVTLPPRVNAMRLRTPLIAAMNGPAAGMGLTLPLSWDVRFATVDAKYSFVFTRRGIVPEMSSTWLLPRLIGLSRATELLLSGRSFTGAEALEMGLVSRALPAHEVLPAATKYARDLAAYTSPAAVAATKELLYDAAEEPERSTAESREDLVFRWFGAQPDAVEGVKSFLEKRQPQWSMSKNAHYPGDLT